MTSPPPSPHSLAADPHTLARDLSAAALLGTAKSAPSPSSRPAATAANPEQSLLDRAAAAFLQARAGWLPPLFTGELPPPSAADSRPPCSDRAAGLLLELLGGPSATVLPEWLSLCAARGRRIPESALPSLLAATRTKRDLHPLIREVIGERGRWLAAMNPEWSFAAPARIEHEHVDTVWQTGGPTERTALLAALRESDPARARQLIESTWSTDPPEARSAFLDTLRHRLSMEDEPFLESILDDKRKPICTAAADLLARLPDSRLSHRMTARLFALIRFEPGGKSGPLRRNAAPTIHVEPPKSIDKETIRDGIDDKAEAGKGQRASWLRQFVARAPLKAWADHTGATPETLIAAALETDWAAPLIGGWVEAAERSADEAWAAALFTDSVLSHKDAHTWQFTLHACLRRLPRDVRDPIFARTIRNASGDAVPTALALLQSAPAPWHDDLSRAALTITPPPPKKNRWAPENAQRADLAMLIAGHISPALADQGRAVMSDLNTESPERTGPSTLLAFRLLMHQEFTP